MKLKGCYICEYTAKMKYFFPLLIPHPPSHQPLSWSWFQHSLLLKIISHRLDLKCLFYSWRAEKWQHIQRGGFSVLWDGKAAAGEWELSPFSLRAVSETANTNFSCNQTRRNKFSSTYTSILPQLGGCRACTKKLQFEDIILKFSRSFLLRFRYIDREADFC